MKNQTRKIEDLLNEAIEFQNKGLKKEEIMDRLQEHKDEIIPLLELVEELGSIKNNIEAPKTTLEEIIKKAQIQSPAKKERRFFFPKIWKLAIPMTMATILIFITAFNNPTEDQASTAPASNLRQQEDAVLSIESNKNEISTTNFNPSLEDINAAEEEPTPSPTNE